MTENQAEQEGLTFTGIYARSKDEVKERIAKERKEHPKARLVLVTVPDSKLSRGGRGTGYAAYGDEVYQAYQTLKEARRYVDGTAAALKYLKDEYDKQVKEAEARCELWKKQGAEAEAILNRGK